MPKIQFLVKLKGEHLFKDEKDGSIVNTTSYPLNGSDPSGVKVAVTITGPKELVDKLFTAWPMQAGNNFLVNLEWDAVTIAQILQAQAVGQTPKPKRSHHKKTAPTTQSSPGGDASQTSQPQAPPSPPAIATPLTPPPVTPDDLSKLAEEAGALAKEEDDDEDEDDDEEEDKTEGGE